VLQLNGVEHRFEGRTAKAPPALDIASLSMKAEQLTVIRGPSGSGKTTLLYVLSGLIRPVSGEVRWDDVDIAGLGEGARDRWRRRSAGFVFQNFNLIDEMSPLGNVTLAAYFSAFTDNGMRARGKSLLEQFGVADEARQVSSYSRGEQQRVALARALVFDPPILFADEPTASLDEANSAELCQAFKWLASEGRTVVAVSHDPLLIDAADTVVTLDHGRVVERELVA